MTPAPAVLVLADDLIWSSRLTSLLRSLGARPLAVASEEVFRSRLPEARHAIVDLTARSYDGVAATAEAAGTGLAVVCVGQHDDRELRRRALAAGATRVFAYRKLFEDGPRTLSLWLATEGSG